jgi:two-component system cell cycle sensor histidine kinase/response regulator CckA
VKIMRRDEQRRINPVHNDRQTHTVLVNRSLTWLFSQQHFHLKLLSGTALGIIAIIFLAGVSVFVTLRNHNQEALRTHTTEVMRLSSVIENDIAVLETGHRGFLLTGKQLYLDSFNRQRELIKSRTDELTNLVIDSSAQRKRIMKVQNIVQKWLDKIALPEIDLADAKRTQEAAKSSQTSGILLDTSMLDQARAALHSLQDEEQVVLNNRVREQEWAAQSTRILDFMPKLERSVVAMEKEKRGFLLTGQERFVEGYKHSLADFNTFQGYLSLLVATDPAETAALSAIRENVERWINTSAVPEMAAKRAGKDHATPSSDDASETLMDNIRQSITNFEKNELNRYETWTAAAQRERILKTSALTVVCFIAALLLVVSCCYSFVLCRHQWMKLESADTRIRSMIDNILDGMITVSEHGVIRSMNPAAKKMFGCANNEMVGQNFAKLVPKSYGSDLNAQPVACAWDEMAQRTGSSTLAVGQNRKNVTFPIEISLSEMMVDRQKLYAAMVRDVTERKRFEQELAAEKESLAVTLRSIGDGVITTDVQGRIIMINNAGENLTGWSSLEAIGQPLKSVFDIAIDLAAQARARKTGFRNEAQSILVGFPENSILTSRDGTEHVIEQVASPIRDRKNEVAGVVLVFRDITERQRNEAERRKAETLEQLGLLAGGIAHDFNNLLTAIIGNISLASLLLPPNDEMATRLRDAKNASMRARDLAQQLLTFARGGAPIKKTASIGKLIQDTVSFSLRGTHSRSEFDFGADLWPAEIDAGQISQVVANLVVNADQAMPDGGTLRVGCGNFTYDHETIPCIPDLKPGDYIRISIRDDGIGISESYLKRIFDPYFTTKEKGTGLGLATTYSIIKNHNGLITVESQIHCGSTFTVYLPASLEREVGVEPPVTSTETLMGTGRVLIVDDEEAIRNLVEFTLTRLGYEVFQAGSALEGVDLYREKLQAGERFDLVILDLTLPGGMGGKEALKKLIEIDPTVNAIVSSGYATDATMSRYQDFGFHGVISKPYEAAELGKTVHDVITAGRIEPVADYALEAVG